MTFLHAAHRTTKNIGPWLSLWLCLGSLAVGVMSLVPSVSPAGDQHRREVVDGAALFASRCLICHGPGARAAQLSAMSKLGADSIYETLTSGIMKQQAVGLSETERRAISRYIAGFKTRAEASSAARPCDERLPPAARSQRKGRWNGWSPDRRNTRFQPAPDAGLTAQQVPSLTLTWAFVFPGVVTAANQPTVVKGWLYMGSWDGTIYALDARRGCSYWTFKADSGVRTAIRVAHGLAMFGDFQATVYAVDATTGELRWRTRVEDHPAARITGSPVAYQGRLYVPVSSLEEGVAQDPKYTCCTFRGSVVALDVATGKPLWKTYTIDRVPRRLGMNKAGRPRYGPSGVAIWSAPTIDAQRGVLYVATGNNYTEPDVPATDAVMAIDLTSGAKTWVRSLRPSDRWNAGCLSPDKVNCPPDEGPDFDFGSSPILVRVKGGKDLILAGQKSGVLYALDPDNKGAVVWEIRLGEGGSFGGILWGMATDGERAYVAIADWNVGAIQKGGVLIPSHRANGALTAVDVRTGKRLWRTPNPPGTCQGRRGCSSANAAPVTVIPGVVFLGSLDGHLRAYDARTGRIIWDYDASGEFAGINGIPGHGGSINAAGVTVANGMVYQTAGYGAFGLGMPGNVLLAFSLSGKP